MKLPADGIESGKAVVTFPGLKQAHPVIVARSTASGTHGRLGIRAEHFTISEGGDEGLRTTLLEKAYGGETTTLLVASDRAS